MTSSLMAKIDVAFQKIDELSDNERDVEINGQKIVLGILTGGEEDNVQAFIVERAEKFGKGLYLRDIKIETIAYSIKQINDERIDKVDFFTVQNTEDKIEKVEKHIFLREKLRIWPPLIVNYLFNQYVVLSDETSKTFNPAFEVEGIDDLLQEEVKEGEALLKEAEELAEGKEKSKDKEETTFRKVDIEGTEGVLDQTGY